jgi:hypothetical protein
MARSHSSSSATEAATPVRVPLAASPFAILGAKSAVMRAPSSRDEGDNRAATSAPPISRRRRETVGVLAPSNASAARRASEMPRGRAGALKRASAGLDAGGRRPVRSYVAIAATE